MTKQQGHCTTKVDSCQVPDPVLQLMDQYKGDRLFDSLSYDDQVAYCSLLIEAEEWHRLDDYLSGSFSSGGGIR